jgi:ferredoxin
MELTVDRDLCEANAVCCGLAPAVFELDAEEYLVIKVPNPGPDQLALVTKAVERCPRNALELHQ